MKQKILFVVLVVEGILFLGLSTRYNLQFAGALSCSSIPFVQLGKGLRMLSFILHLGKVLQSVWKALKNFKLLIQREN